jgi:hypothetical protein
VGSTSVCLPSNDEGIQDSSCSLRPRTAPQHSTTGWLAVTLLGLLRRRTRRGLRREP